MSPDATSAAYPYIEEGHDRPLRPPKEPAEQPFKGDCPKLGVMGGEAL